MKIKCGLCKKRFEQAKDGYEIYCQKCQSYFDTAKRIGINANVIYLLETNIKKSLITIDQYLDYFEKQNGLCAICKQKETRTITGRNEPTLLAIDHCHQTGKFRGLLCFRCNSSMGKYESGIYTEPNSKWVQKHKNIIKDYLKDSA